MPFKSKKQEQYLRLNEPEVYSDWKNKYGSYKGAESFSADASYNFTCKKCGCPTFTIQFKKSYGLLYIEAKCEDCGEGRGSALADDTHFIYVRTPYPPHLGAESFSAETKVFNASMYKCPECSHLGYVEDFRDWDAESFNAEGNTQWDKTLAMMRQYDMMEIEGLNYSYNPTGPRKNELPPFINKDLVDTHSDFNGDYFNENVVVFIDYCGDRENQNGKFSGELLVSPRISKQKVIKQLQDWGIDTANHKKWKNFGYFEDWGDGKGYTHYNFPIPNLPCQWSNAYVRDTEYDDDGTAYTTFGQDCIKCKAQRRGNISGDVSWDKNAETFNAEEWWEEYRDELESVDPRTLDMFEQREFKRFQEMKLPKAKAMQMLINSVEGDYSQLSPRLAKVAQRQEEAGAWGAESFDAEEFRAEDAEYQELIELSNEAKENYMELVDESDIEEFCEEYDLDYNDSNDRERAVSKYLEQIPFEPHIIEALDQDEQERYYQLKAIVYGAETFNAEEKEHRVFYSVVDTDTGEEIDDGQMVVEASSMKEALEKAQTMLEEGAYVGEEYEVYPNGMRVSAETFDAQTATPISPLSKAPKCKCVANRDDATWDERRLGVKGITMSGPFYAKENGKQKAYWACQYCGPQWEDKLVLESEATATIKGALYSLATIGVGVFIFNKYVKDKLPTRGEE